MSTFNSVMFAVSPPVNYNDDNNRATVSFFFFKYDSSHTINKVRGRFGLEHYCHFCSSNSVRLISALLLMSLCEMSDLSEKSVFQFNVTKSCLLVASSFVLQLASSTCQHVSICSVGECMS